MHDLLGDPIEPERRRGRAAGSNPANRYDRMRAERADDGWARDPDAPLRTEVALDTSRTILARNTSPDVPFDRSINPYRGCEHGCIYCFARPTHAQLGLSPGLDFETRLVAKPNAAALLRDALRRPGYAPAPIALGTNTDPYQRIEKEWALMRGILEVLWEHRHPLTITTKGQLILRDVDLLARFAQEGLVQVTVSVTTLDNRLSREMEPRAAAPARRMAMIRALSQAGVPTAVGIAPIVPGLTDHEIETLLKAAAAAGATSAGLIMLRLPLEVAPLFQDWLERTHPDRAARVLARVTEVHGGKLYDATWHKRVHGEGVYANMIKRRFALQCKKLGLGAKDTTLRCDLFRVPPRAGDQLTLGL